MKPAIIYHADCPDGWCGDMVKVRIHADEDGEAVWLDRLDEHADADDPEAWIGEIPAARLDDLQTAHEVINSIIWEAVKTTTRGMDGEWNRPCAAFSEGPMWPAEHYWLIKRSPRCELARRFESEADALTALGRIQSGTGFLMTYGPRGGTEMFAVVDVADWWVEEVNSEPSPIGFAGLCHICRWERDEHGTVS